MREQEKVLAFSQSEFERRHKKIREGMQLRNIECLLVVDIPNIRYISGVFVATPMSSGVLIFPLLETPNMLVMAPHTAARMEKASYIPINAVSFRKGQPGGVRIREFAPDIVSRVKELGIEKRTIGLASWRAVPAYLFEELKRELPYANFVSAGDVLLECRRTKSAEELECIRKAAQIADVGIQALVNTARPGVTEADLVAACDYAMVRAGCDRGTMLLLDSGPFEEKQGAIGDTSQSQRRLQKGDIILNELSPLYKGYNVQLCVPISVHGDVPKSFTDRMNIDNELYEFTLNELRPGRRYGEIEKRVFELAEKLAPRFYRRVWSLQANETDPGQDRLTFVEFKPGMVWINHPWTEPASGKGHEGHTIGNTVIITEGEPEVTSRWPRELVVV